MRDSAEFAIQFATGRLRADIENDRFLESAVVREVVVIGEAANHVSAETRALAPVIDWGKIVGMRNRLIRGYANINHNVLWDVITDELPPLLIELKRLIEAKYGAQND